MVVLQSNVFCFNEKDASISHCQLRASVFGPVSQLKKILDRVGHSGEIDQHWSGNSHICVGNPKRFLTQMRGI